MAGINKIQIIGLGLIGTSVGFALKNSGYFVTGFDIDSERIKTALEIGAIDAGGLDFSADLAFVAVPVKRVVPIAKLFLGKNIEFSEDLAIIVAERDQSLAKGSFNQEMIITDVAGIKATVAGEVTDKRFIGGHPMAGSERLGPQGADPKLFEGATWVLTPTEHTDHDAFMKLSSLIRQMGAEVVSLEPDRHDRLVATVSHVPHLTAANLMLLAHEQSFSEAALLRLAAGGFRDMTRISAGDPEIWPDVLLDNAPAVIAALNSLIGKLSSMRSLIEEKKRPELYEILQQAQVARRNLPRRGLAPEDLVEIATVITDQPGVLAEITTLLGKEGINLYNLEIVHPGETKNGVLVMVIERKELNRAQSLLSDKGYALDAKEEL